MNHPLPSPKYNFVRVEKTSTYLRWTIARPERLNGLGPSVINELLSLSHEAVPDRPLILDAAPIHKEGQQPIWVAGGDLIELNELKTPEDVTAYVKSIHQLIAWCENYSAPVITLIDGHAIGGGAEFSLTGDIRIATERSSWHFKQGSLGLTTGFGGAHRLVDLIGPTRAESLVYGIKTLSAHDALNWGIIHELTMDAPMTIAEKWCQILKQWHPETFAAQKKMFQHARHGQRGSHRDVETQLFVSIWGNPQHRMKIEKFLTRKSTD